MSDRKQKLALTWIGKENRPRLEEWLVCKAKSIGISLADFKLPEDGEVLHSIPHYERNENFDEFLTKLLTSDDEEINKLRKWLMGNN